MSICILCKNQYLDFTKHHVCEECRYDYYKCKAERIARTDDPCLLCIDVTSSDDCDHTIEDLIKYLGDKNE